ncbi:MAG: hypothetical protein HW377_1960 [Actinobacteria bacterium]|nr:hypothetical protein [Actinomycetota bacterium]
MVSHMKTTIQIPDSLFEEARKVAQRERVTMRSLVEAGLRRVLADHATRGGFRLRKAAFRGKGLQPGMEGASWDRIRDASYEGRGG